LQKLHKILTKSQCYGDFVKSAVIQNMVILRKKRQPNKRVTKTNNYIILWNSTSNYAFFILNRCKNQIFNIREKKTNHL